MENICRANMFGIYSIFIAQGCDLKMNKCDSWQSFTIPDMCKVFEQKNQIWSDLVAHTQPRMKSPIKPSTIRVRNATSDTTFITYLPLDDRIWTVTFRTFKRIPNIRFKKRLVSCLMVEAAIFKNDHNLKEH